VACRLAQETIPRWGEVEGYSAARFFTLTGRAIGTHPVAEIQGTLDSLAARFGGDRRQPAATSQQVEPHTSSVGADSDDELIHQAMAATNGVKFGRLWNGDTSDYGGDDSRADLALCGVLAFWCVGDAGHIDRLFRRSGLMRRKWNEHRGEMTYGQLTIAKALEGKTEFYTRAPGNLTRKDEHTNSRR